METTSHDALNRALIQAAASQGNALYEYDYAYDPVGNVDKVTETYPSGLANRTVTNTYDKIYRLLSETEATASGTEATAYTYDAANNRLSKIITGGAHPGTASYTYNAVNQMTGFSEGTRDVSLTYDPNGNRATRVIDSGTDTYSYDFENRLVGLQKNIAGIAGAGITTGTYAYAYDYRTRRVTRDESGTSGGVTTKVIFSGGSSVLELDNGSTSPTVEYIRGSDYGGGVGGVLYTLRGTTPSYTHENRRGDVVAKTDGSGSLTYQAAYKAFGAHPIESGTTADRQKANTKDEDPTGLLNEGFRYRDLDTGEFITKDPAGFVDGPNLYTYVRQNPWTKFDPEGLYEIDVHQYLTQYLASMAGFSPTMAKEIGIQSQGPDAVYPGGIGDPRDAQYDGGANLKNMALYHFVSAKRLIEMRSKVINEIEKKQNPMRAMGEYFHALEDTYAHSNKRGDRDMDNYYHDHIFWMAWLGDYGHAFHYHDPDWTWEDVPKGMKMAKEVYRQMRFFSQLMNDSAKPMPFGSFDLQVRQFMSHPADTGTELLNILFGLWIQLLLKGMTKK